MQGTSASPRRSGAFEPGGRYGVYTAERLVGGLLAGDCTSRDCALDLLTADALVTYAFEAAEQSPGDLVPRAAAAMRRIAALGATP